ncbi:3-hydroxyacyl-[acyl-carrier-protein] dehydratase FabZ [Trichinella spiralis]|uniref:3-hydroxyacyl-[acyl-carrier-protein] dehydratase FabZ n=1 Tax=Trichinella spiralis TaxID=6334 RepID=A0ABR3KAL2_TRISP
MCGGYSCCLLANQLCYACVYKRNEVEYRAKWITTLANARHSAAITCSPRTMRQAIVKESCIGIKQDRH